MFNISLSLGMCKPIRLNIRVLINETIEMFFRFVAFSLCPVNLNIMKSVWKTRLNIKMIIQADMWRCSFIGCSRHEHMSLITLPTEPFLKFLPAGVK